MKSYDNFDNSFFLKIICLIAGIALLLVMIFFLVNWITDGKGGSSDTEGETYVMPSATTPTYDNTTKETEFVPAPIITDSDTTALPSPDTTDETTDEATDTETEQSPETELPAPTETLLPESADMGDGYIDKFVFVGSSTTYGLQAYGVLSGGKSTKQVWVSNVQGKTLSLNDILTKTIVYPENKKEMTICEAAKIDEPEYMILSLGIEGLSSLSKDEFIAEYRGLIKALKIASPTTKIILQSIFPVADSFSGNSKINNKKIVDANGWILALAEDEGVKYLDTHSVLLDSKGNLDPKYDNGGNGINLNAEGYEKVIEYIRTHGF